MSSNPQGKDRLDYEPTVPSRHFTAILPRIDDALSGRISHTSFRFERLTDRLVALAYLLFDMQAGRQLNSPILAAYPVAANVVKARAKRQAARVYTANHKAEDTFVALYQDGPALSSRQWSIITTLANQFNVYEYCHPRAKRIRREYAEKLYGEGVN